VAGHAVQTIGRRKRSAFLLCTYYAYLSYSVISN